MGWMDHWRLWRFWRPRVLQIYCDGSAHDRPRKPGGWAFVVIRNNQIVLFNSGAHPRATSTQMELLAAVEGLEAVWTQKLYRTARVELVSDCQLTVEVASGRHLPTVDRALAVRVRQAALAIDARPHKIRAHSGNFWNEHVDRAARQAKQTLASHR